MSGTYLEVHGDLPTLLLATPLTTTGLTNSPIFKTGTYAAFKRPQYVQIGNEQLRVLSLDPNAVVSTAYLTAPTPNTKVATLSVDSSAIIAAAVSSGTPFRLGLNGESDIEVTGVLGDTSIQVNRHGFTPGDPVHASGGELYFQLSFSSPLEVWNSERGVNGTALSDHPKDAVLRTLYSTADFLRTADAREFTEVWLMMRTATASSWLPRDIRHFPKVRVRAAIAMEGAMTLALPADADVTIRVGPARKPIASLIGVEMYLVRVADAFGVPTTTEQGSLWYAGGSSLVTVGDHQFPSFAEDSGLSASYSRTADNRGVKVSTAGWYSVSFWVRASVEDL